MSPIGAFVIVSYVLAFAVDTFECMGAWLTLFYF